MKYLRFAPQDEVIWAFLRGEWDSARFGKGVRAAMQRARCPEEYILNAHFDDAKECSARLEALADCRGWGSGSGLFERFPERIRWLLAQCEVGDLGALSYIRYSYWDELSDWTGSALKSAQSVRAGKEVFGVSNAAFVSGAEYLRAGGQFEPMIALCSAEPRFVMLEGHSRLTAYALAPERFAGALCYVGWCARGALNTWAGPKLNGAPDGYDCE